MKVRLKSMGFQSKSRKKSIKNEQNQPLPVWGGPLECRYTVCNMHYELHLCNQLKFGIFLP